MEKPEIKKLSNEEVVKKAIDSLVSDMACCDRDGCRCFEAQSWMKRIKEYAESRFCPACHGGEYPHRNCILR